MFRKLIVALAALALVVGLAPVASAQTGTTNIDDFRFDVSLDSGQSALRPGGHVRFNISATNTRSGLPLIDNRVINTYGLTVPDGFTLHGSGGTDFIEVGNHDQGPNYWGGKPRNFAFQTVQPGASRSGWLTLNIPANAQGGTEFRFGVRAHLGTGGSWKPTRDNVVRFTLPAVGTRTTVMADPVNVQEGGSTTLTAAVSPVHGTNTVDSGEVEFRVNGTALGRVPLEADGRASIPHTVPLLADRTPVPQQVTAHFLGLSPRFASSQSPVTTITVQPEPKTEITSTIGVELTRGLIDDGRLPVNLGITVNTSDGLDLPAGARVEVLRNGTVIGTAEVDGVTATFTDMVDAVVTEATAYTYTVRMPEIDGYDTIHRGTTSDPVRVTLAPEFVPALTVSVDPTTVLIGRPVDITATMDIDDAPVPAGADVIIRVNGRDIGTVQTDANGNALLPDHVFTTAGEKSIVAVFEGGEVDGTAYEPSTSAPVLLTVDALPEVDSGTVIELQTEATAGDEVALTAFVSRADGADLSDEAVADLGSVWFFQDGQAVGSAPVTVDPDTGIATAVFTHRFAERGEYRMTAEYSGVTVGEEIISPSETTAATIITVSPTELVIEEPGPPPTDGGGEGALGSLDLGSVMDLMGDSGSLGSLSAAS